MPKLALFFIVAILTTPVYAQEIPAEDDSPAYKEAYELIFDSHARTRKAEKLLDEGKKKVADLNAKELSLLCRIYNEMFDHEKQFAAAKDLWTRFPDDPEGTNWMVNSMLNRMRDEKGILEVTDFVDTALANKKGIRSELLVLKAQAILAMQKKITDAERRVMVSDILIEAYVSHDPLKKQSGFPDLDNPNFLDLDNRFSKYFSTVEREALKVRMKKAKDARN